MNKKIMLVIRKINNKFNKIQKYLNFKKQKIKKKKIKTTMIVE